MLRDGTYVREPDGAWHLFHSETTWNDPVQGLARSRELGLTESALMGWRKVSEQSERDALREHLCGELLPGEYVEVRETSAR